MSCNSIAAGLMRHHVEQLPGNCKLLFLQCLVTVVLISCNNILYTCWIMFCRNVCTRLSCKQGMGTCSVCSLSQQTGDNHPLHVMLGHSLQCWPNILLSNAGSTSNGFFHCSPSCLCNTVDPVINDPAINDLLSPTTFFSCTGQFSIVNDL